MIYLDTSVALAHLLAEDVVPPVSPWRQPLVSSRLLEYELWVRLHARGLRASHGDAARDLVARLGLLGLIPEVLSRAMEPFPAPVRTLDALHLASIDFLRQQGQVVTLASYDQRQRVAAAAMGVALVAL